MYFHIYLFLAQEIEQQLKSRLNESEDADVKKLKKQDSTESTSSHVSVDDKKQVNYLNISFVLLSDFILNKIFFAIIFKFLF